MSCKYRVYNNGQSSDIFWSTSVYDSTYQIYCSHAGSSGTAMSSPNHGGYKETIIFTGLFSAHNQSNFNSTTCSVKYTANYPIAGKFDRL